ncbi:MAG: hypothetical protein ACQEP8_00530 [Chlamydiota bacterium]
MNLPRPTPHLNFDRPMPSPDNLDIVDLQERIISIVKTALPRIPYNSILSPYPYIKAVYDFRQDNPDDFFLLDNFSWPLIARKINGDITDSFDPNLVDEESYEWYHRTAIFEKSLREQLIRPPRNLGQPSNQALLWEAISNYKVENPHINDHVLVQNSSDSPLWKLFSSKVKDQSPEECYHYWSTRLRSTQSFDQQVQPWLKDLTSHN